MYSTTLVVVVEGQCAMMDVWWHQPIERQVVAQDPLEVRAATFGHLSFTIGPI